MTTEPSQSLSELGEVVEPGHVIAGKYRVVQVLGVGGMGVVVQAWHLQLDERVAIKFLLPELATNTEACGRFEREARAAFKLRSEHAVRIFDVGQLETDAPYIVMEFLEGADMATTLEKGGALAVNEAVDYVLQACEAVAEAHSHGIVHRDLKPENLFVTHRPDGSSCIKVLDFGLSKVTEQVGTPTRERSLTASNTAMGSPAYMSPEQWMSASDVGLGTDIWALGAILFELVTGRQPFAHKELPKLCALVLNGAPPPPRSLRSELPAALERVILRCLDKNPTERYPSVAALAAALVEFGPEHARSSAQRIARTLQGTGTAAPAAAGAPLAASGSPHPKEDEVPTLPQAKAAPAGADDPTGKARAGAEHALPVPVRTAQSWQQALGQEGSGRSRVLWIVGGAVAASGLLGAVAVTVLPQGSVAPATSTSPPAVAAPLGSLGSAGPEPELVPSGVEQPDASLPEPEASVAPPVPTVAPPDSVRRPPQPPAPRPVKKPPKTIYDHM